MEIIEHGVSENTRENYGEVKSRIFMGRGKCNHPGCQCTAYTSDSSHSGYCTCLHTAAEHA